MTLPLDAASLTQPHFFVSSELRWNDQVLFSVYNEKPMGVHQRPVCTVTAPVVSGWSPARSQVSIMPGGERLDADAARSFSEVLLIAAEFCAIWNQDYELQFAAMEKRQEEEAAARRAEREAREREYAERRAQREAEQKKLHASCYEALKWYLDHRIRISRHGMRSIVFGTMDKVNEMGWIELTTEKGKYMRLSFNELEYVEVKEEPTDKKYERIYTDDRSRQYQ